MLLNQTQLLSPEEGCFEKGDDCSSRGSEYTGITKTANLIDYREREIAMEKGSEAKQVTTEGVNR